MMDIRKQPGTVAAGIDLHAVQPLGEKIERQDTVPEKVPIRLRGKFLQADCRFILIPPLLHHIPVSVDKTGFEIPMGREGSFHGRNQRLPLYAVEQSNRREIVLGSTAVSFPVNEDASLILRDGIQFPFRIG